MQRLVVSLGIALVIAACGADEAGIGGGEDEIQSVRSFVAKGTGYFPDPSPMEGGFVDVRGAKLRTLQEFVSGQADYVSVAMDASAFKYGQRLRIAEVNAKIGRDVIFRVVDTGGAFRGKGTSRIDICTANQKASLDATINGTLHIDAIEERSPPPAPPPASKDPGPPPSTSPVEPAPGDPPREQGAACKSDSSCNTGNDGLGLICVDSRCTPGCHANAQCPGSKNCSSGQCR